MCWNKDVSINTFVFTCLGLLFIYYANTYTKYKNSFLSNVYCYIFFLLFSSMQLLEHFIWKNLKNEQMNMFLSKIGLLIILLQPIAALSMSITDDLTRRNKMIFYYVVTMSVILIYKYFVSPFDFTTTVAKNGHLMWNWLNMKGFECIFIFIWLFYLLGGYQEEYFFYLCINILVVCVCLLMYFRQGTFGSIWCWVVNFYILFFIIDILLVQPFLEYKSIC